MRAIRGFAAALLAVGVVTVVSAQRQPGGGFGGGGFGGTQDTVMMVLSNKDLQEEVKVTDAQKDKFKEIASKQKEMSDKISAGMKEKFADAKNDREKMTEIFTEMRKENEKVSAETKKLLDAELTADQLKRLKQIDVQRLGFTVLTTDPDAKVEAPKGGKGGGGFGGGGFGGFGVSESQKATIREVQKALNLTDSQKSSIKGISSELSKESREIRTEAGIGGFGGGGKGKAPDAEKVADANKKIDKLSKEAWSKVDELFDDNQRKVWKETVGESFDTAKLRPQFGGGRPQPKKD